MQQSAPSRKRPAPGASPMAQQPITPQPQQQSAYSFPLPDNTDFSNFDFSAAFPADAWADPSLADTNNYNAALNAQQPPTYPANITPTPSTDLVRRGRNTQLAAQNGQQEQWNSGYGNMNGQEEEDERELDMKVQTAKREAQGKRKQIPPFVQKLSSFLDNNNTQLIRWSDDGRSFIVLDEDEFARTLIPELFKHNNYASFVRQLNMYGFHKTVNITDGSLRQSEKARKGVKPPSMYSHPYFRKNRPDLLWLIQKPTSKSKPGKPKSAQQGSPDSDEDRQFSPAPEGKPGGGELGAPGAAQDVATMPRTELNAVRQEIKKLQQQQGMISRMIGQLREQNDQFYRQATQFQALHDRHENSINAILTFLATFYNRSLEGHSGQNLVNMFSNANNQNNQQQGSVVEEYNDNANDANTQIQRYMKKPQLLLPGPNAPYGQTGNAMTEPNSARHSVSPPSNTPTPVPPKRESTASAPPQGAGIGTSATSPSIKNDGQTPDLLNSVPENDPMLDFINNVNATAAATPNTPAFDFGDAIDQYQNSQGPLTSQQRDNMLALMANQQEGNDSNALVTQTNPDFYKQYADNNNRRLSTLQDLQSRNQQQLENLHKIVAPYSPGGTLPGFQETQSNEGDPIPFSLSDPGAPPYDSSAAAEQYGQFDQFADNADLEFVKNHTDLDSAWADFEHGGGIEDDMFDTVAGEGNGEDFLAVPSAQQLEGGESGHGSGTVESLSSEATSPAEGPGGGEQQQQQSQETPNKRRRIE